MKLLCAFIPFLLLLVPYQVDQRPLPAGNDFSKLLPAKVGNFNRIDFKAPQPGLDGEATYRYGKKEIFMLFSLSKDKPDMKETMQTILTEIKNEKTTDRHVSLKTQPMYIRFQGPTIAFFAWTRGLYCFSADAKGGSEADLDLFMKSFPY